MTGVAIGVDENLEISHPNGAEIITRDGRRRNGYAEGIGKLPDPPTQIERRLRALVIQAPYGAFFMSGREVMVNKCIIYLTFRVCFFQYAAIIKD